MKRKEETIKALEEFLKDKDQNLAFALGAGFMFGAEWADETMIDKVCKYLKTLVYQDYPGGPLVRQIDDEQLEKLKEAIKE